MSSSGNRVFSIQFTTIKKYMYISYHNPDCDREQTRGDGSPAFPHAKTAPLVTTSSQIYSFSP